LVRALSVKVSVPVTGPTDVGENVTPTLQFSPAGILAPQELLDKVNPELAVTLLDESATLRRLVAVTVLPKAKGNKCNVHPVSHVDPSIDDGA
jgi:hypothetical protein